jgi:uncharacterized membrane protein
MFSRERAPPCRGYGLRAQTSLIGIAAFGFIIAWHHRIRQREKFEIIRAHEEALGLYSVKQAILSQYEAKRHLLRIAVTVRFIELVQILIAFIAVVLLIAKARA